ncbi:MAG: cupin domain-containing protein [Pseudobdellovibrionaceae bacterium]
MQTSAIANQNSFLFVEYNEIISKTPDTEGKNVKVWKIRQNNTIRINLVEMSGELSLHKHPDADHSLMVLEGQVRVKIADKLLIANKGDFISIPANIPHKYWSLTPKSILVSMDAPYYDPSKTISLE